jgi:hypothetical protein
MIDRLRSLFRRTASSSPATVPSTKREVLDRLLTRGPVYIYVDARREHVVVPDRFRHQAELSLMIGRSMVPPIADLAITETGISGTLAFDEVAFHCTIPWNALYAACIKDRPETLSSWPEDVPHDVPPAIRTAPPTISTPREWNPGWPSKHRHIEALLDQATVLLYLDATREDVLVPDAHKSQSELVLRVGRVMSPPSDLAVDKHALSATLMFDGVPCRVVIPWDAVVAANIEGWIEGFTWRAELPTARRQT